MSALNATATAFVEMAHQIVWATVATTSADGRPRTRVLHPIWEWDGASLTGWIATSPHSPKADDLAANPAISLTYWSPSQDTCTADCTTTWVSDAAGRHTAWKRFVDAPEPVGYDPAIIPGWDDADSESFGALQLTPTWLRVFPGTLLLEGRGELLTWRA